MTPAVLAGVASVVVAEARSLPEVKTLLQGGRKFESREEQGMVWGTTQ